MKQALLLHVEAKLPAKGTIETMGADVVRPPFKASHFHRPAYNLCKPRQVPVVELVLQGLTGRRYNNRGARRKRRDKVGEGFTNPRSCLCNK